MNLDLIQFYAKNKVGYIYLTTPPKNEMNSQFFGEFKSIVDHIKLDTELKGVIISSEGRHFSSGADIDELLGFFSENEKVIPNNIKENSQAFIDLYTLNIPVVACLKGICYGSAFEMALSAHFRIAAPNTLICLPESTFGIMPGLGGIYHSCTCMGTANTLEFVLSGKVFSTEEAKKIGLIDILANKKDLLHQAFEIIKVTNYSYNKRLKNKYLRALSNLTC